MATVIDGRVSGFKTNPDYKVTFEASPRRVRVKFNGEWVADSTAAHLLYETRHLPVYYFPRADVRMDKLVPTDHHTFCPYKGTASYWTIRVGDKSSENAVWGYPDPYDEVPALKDFVAFYWDRVDGWYEEDEEIFVHPRSPYTRVDALRSTRTVRVELDGVVLATSPSPVMVFETGLPTRYYLNRTEVNAEHLLPTATVTACPYKGKTSGYWSVQVGETVYPDLAWAYDFPTRQLLPIAGLIAFYNEKVDIFLDGAHLERPVTHFSS
jgi:uncharacterized protein (DUF427 family)